MPKNSAFVFVKPHANTPATCAMVSAGLQAAGLTILQEGTLGAAEIDSKKLIDQHYYAIASKATILKPAQLNVPADKFQAKFGLTWTDALAQGNVFNALDACARLGITADQMDKEWAKAKKADKLVKFGGGFYCGLVEVQGQTPLYVFNGFFMEMRSKFTAPGVSLHFYLVEWDAAALSWADFRGQLLGPTDPADAPAGSLRGKIAAQWQALGLEAAPNVGDNGVHASASPFEALAERMNWVGAALEGDAFGQALLTARVPAATIKAWTLDPQVKKADGSNGSLFDSVEDTNADVCIEKLVALALLNGGLAPQPLPLNPAQGPKVITIAAGETAYLCTCGQSANFPYCDGSHKAYNAAHGTAYKSKAVKNESAAEETKYICRCGFSEKRPFCDGSHASLDEKQIAEIQTKAAAFKNAQTVKEVKKYAFYAAVGGALAFAVYWAVGRFGGKQAEKSKK